jgi:hypothetical protein
VVIRERSLGESGSLPEIQGMNQDTADLEPNEHLTTALPIQDNLTS